MVTVWKKANGIFNTVLDLGPAGDKILKHAQFRKFCCL